MVLLYTLLALAIAVGGPWLLRFVITRPLPGYYSGRVLAELVAAVVLNWLGVGVGLFALVWLTDIWLVGDFVLPCFLGLSLAVVTTHADRISFHRKFSATFPDRDERTVIEAFQLVELLRTYVLLYVGKVVTVAKFDDVTVLLCARGRVLATVGVEGYSALHIFQTLQSSLGHSWVPDLLEQQLTAIKVVCTTSEDAPRISEVYAD